MKIYGIRNCDTMKKAFAFLEAKKVAYDFHDYKKDGVPPGKLKEWAKRVGWERLANTRGPKNASAIKRPVLEAGAKLLVGFEPAQYEKL